MIRLLRLAACVPLLLGCAGERPRPAQPPPAKPMPTPEPAPTPPAPSPAPPSEPPPAEDVPAAVSVVFRVDPVVGEAPPTLHITVRNEARTPAPLVVFEDPRCAAQHLLDLRIARRGQPVALTGCVATAWPGRDDSLAPGAEHRLAVPLAALADRWPAGTYTIEVDWAPGRLGDARPSAAVVRTTQSSINTGEFTVARARAAVRVRRGQTVDLPDGARLRFAGNSHKSVGPGDTSPLIVVGTFTAPRSAGPEEFSINLHLEHSRQFTIAGCTFELGEYAYDEWMDLRYWGRVAGPP